MRLEIGASASTVAVAVALAVAMMGTTLPTPLYAGYAAAFDLAPVLTPVIFAMYALGVVGALLYLGYLSDEVGRRRMMLPALALSAVSSGTFVAAHGLTLLLVGRFLSGLSTGVVSGAGTAWLVDLAGKGRAQEQRATLIAVGSNLAGLACGPLLAGILATWCRWPLRLPYVVDLVLLVPVTIGVALAQDARGRTRSFGSARFRRQKITVAPEARSSFVRAAIAGAAAFAVAGVLNAVAPSFLGKNLHLTSPVTSGLLVAVFFFSGVGGQLALQKVPARGGLALGCVALLAGLGCLALALGLASPVWLFAGASCGGLGEGLAVGAGLAQINAKLGDKRSETDSTYYLALYLGVSLPTLGVGFLSAGTNLVTAGFVFCAVTAASVSAALVMIALAPRDKRTFETKEAMAPS